MVAGNALSRGVYVVAAKRTPFGTFGGSLKAHSPTDMQVPTRAASVVGIPTFFKILYFWNQRGVLCFISKNL